MEALGIMVITLAIIVAAAVMWWAVQTAERLYERWQGWMWRRQTRRLLDRATSQAYRHGRPLRISHR